MRRFYLSSLFHLSVSIVSNTALSSCRYELPDNHPLVEGVRKHLPSSSNCKPQIVNQTYSYNIIKVAAISHLKFLHIQGTAFIVVDISRLALC